MKGNVIEYRGYYAKVEYDSEDRILFGKIEGINDLVNFEGSSVEEIETAFHQAVDDYLAFCQEAGKEPDKTYRGSFNVRIRPSLHQAAAIAATKEGMTLNQFVEQSIEKQIHAIG